MKTRNIWAIKSCDRNMGVAVVRYHEAVLIKIWKRVFLCLHILLEINLVLCTNPGAMLKNKVNSNLSLNSIFLEDMIPLSPTW